MYNADGSRKADERRKEIMDCLAEYKGPDAIEAPIITTRTYVCELCGQLYDHVHMMRMMMTTI